MSPATGENIAKITLIIPKTNPIDCFLGLAFKLPGPSYPRTKYLWGKEI